MNRLSVIVCALIAGLASAAVAAEKVWSDTHGEYVDPDASPQTIPSPARPPESSEKLEWNETYGEYMPPGQEKRVIKSNPRQPMSGEKVWSETYGDYIYKTPEASPEAEAPADREK